MPHPKNLIGRPLHKFINQIEEVRAPKGGNVIDLISRNLATAILAKDESVQKEELPNNDLLTD
jgi:hypothetical protein